MLEELYVGAVEAKVRRDLQRMEREFDKIGRLLLPGRGDWTGAEQVLSRIGQKYEFNLVSRARLTNDAVIAMSVASHGFTIQTKNPGDFHLIAEFRPFNCGRRYNKNVLSRVRDGDAATGAAKLYTTMGFQLPTTDLNEAAAAADAPREHS